MESSAVDANIEPAKREGSEARELVPDRPTHCSIKKMIDEWSRDREDLKYKTLHVEQPCESVMTKNTGEV